MQLVNGCAMLLLDVQLMTNWQGYLDVSCGIYRGSSRELTIADKLLRCASTAVTLFLLPANSANNIMFAKRGPKPKPSPACP